VTRDIIGHFKDESFQGWEVGTVYAGLQLYRAWYVRSTIGLRSNS